MKYIIDQIKEYILETNADISNIETYYNLEGDYVAKFELEGEDYLLKIDTL